MSLQRPWLDSYPKGVPAQIDISQYQSILSVLDQVCEKYADKPGFASFGTQLSYGEIERLSRQFASRSEEHTSELQSLMRISYAVFCLKKKNKKINKLNTDHLTSTNITIKM